MVDATDLPDFENMSDEDFLNMESPAPSDVSLMSDSVQGTFEDTIEAGEAPAAEEDAPDAAPVVLDDGHTTPHQPAAQQQRADDAEGEPASDPAGSPKAPAAPAAASAEDAAPLDFEKSYKQIMAPFKANGKDFTPSSPEEAVRLMQMGANYTKKMQALTPNLKLMRMLENNNLLEEGKINYLIDLNRKDPSAIQKLLHESKIDPLDLNVVDEPTYTPGNHSVSDRDMLFHETLGDVTSTQGGKETIQMVNAQWDRASKEAIYNEPSILTIITEQRANGIFDQISAEMDRQKILGNLGNIPFIQAYKQVGDQLHQQGLLRATPASDVQGQQSNPGSTAQPRVLETRTAAPKAKVSNDAAARAASSAKSATKSAPTSFDPFSMTDAEIMAINNPRA